MTVEETIRKNRSLLERIFSGNEELTTIRDTLRNEAGIVSFREKPVIATGHQPVPYYPGLLFKNYFTGKHSEELGAQSFNFLVDSDQNVIEVPVPCYKNDQFSKEMVTLKADKETVFAHFEPQEQDLETFLKRIDDSLQTLDIKEVIEAYQNWKDKFIAVYNEKQDFIDALNAMRNRFENNLGIQLEDRRISEITNTRAFYHFVYYIIQNTEEFSNHFNQAIQKHSSENYQPVKSIENDNGWIELPFWLVQKHKRHTVRVKKGTNLLTLSSPALQNQINIADENSDEAIDSLKSQVTFFPKANTLTLMFRLFLCDLFVHGTGAREYEQVNNDFIQSFFNLSEKLIFYTVTGDIYLPLIHNLPQYEKVESEYNQIRSWLKEADRKPEGLLDSSTARRYKQKKKDIATKMRNEPDSKEREKLHNQLMELDNEMKRLLSGKIERNHQALNYLSYLMENKKVFYERQYPYFIYPDRVLEEEKFEKNIKLEWYE